MFKTCFLISFEINSLEVPIKFKKSEYLIDKFLYYQNCFWKTYYFTYRCIDLNDKTIFSWFYISKKLSCFYFFFFKYFSKNYDKKWLKILSNILLILRNLLKWSLKNFIKFQKHLNCYKSFIVFFTYILNLLINEIINETKKSPKELLKNFL